MAIDLAPQTVAEDVYQQIRRNILDGRIAPGTRVSIRSLAQSVGVSTMPTREALKRLHFEGLVEFDRRAVTVTDLTPGDLRELFAIRLTLESLATQWALTEITSTDLTELRRILDLMDDPHMDPPQWRELNREFHQTFYACGNSRYLMELISNVWDRIQPYMAIYSSVVDNFPEAHRQHEHMYRLMADRDLDGLLAATRHHLEHTADSVIRTLDTAHDTHRKTSMNFEELDVASFHTMIGKGEVTSATLTAWYLDRIADIDSVANPDGLQLNSVVTLNPAALEDARRIDEQYARTGALVGPLHGVPILIKDQGETKGIPTSFGSRAFADYVPESDATVVERLRSAGAVILGKTTMCDFAAGWFSFSSRSDHTKNPYDLDRETGGSSAGTAAAVSANLCLVGIGEDTGGSIRLPSSFTNLFGLRVTTGLVPRTGFSPLLHFQDTPGPMARNVSDLAAVLDVVVGYDPTDDYTTVATSAGVGDYLDAIADVDADTVADYRVGVLTDAFGAGLDQELTNGVVRAAIERLRDSGTAVVDDLVLGGLPEWVQGTSLYTISSKKDIDEFLAARPTAPVTSVEALVAAGDFHPLTDLVVDIADGPSIPEDDPEYLPRRLRQDEWRRTLMTIMADAGVDFLVYPTVQVPAPTRADLAAKRWTALDFPTNTVIASQTTMPAISIPVGFTDVGLPVGLEVLGRPLAEKDLLRFARAWELTASPRRQAAAVARVGA
ncbi:amidase family protein [Gordonia soli]|uniref:Putative GntR family transcriptional regulator/amidase n=1 Tax=Gordonia soli NBRC 108243 TaxID=1223545 RepID=M0QPV8_9ACTN|nr:amidase family protein [Gordonia soli]GAC70404.1 putative GntR family transcriptional regulator/amidase [Gordonia soli NBRC 108243]